jgi:hypothetical protein
MRNWTDSQLDSLYEIASEKPGWLSKLQTNMNVSDDDASYLIWRDENDAVVKEKLREWEDSFDRELDGLETAREKLSVVNARIDAIEKEGDEWVGENRFLFLGLSDRDRLCSLRYKLRNIVMAEEMPDRMVQVTDAEIEAARTVPLDKLIKPLPRSRKIRCPYHREKTPSFHVYERGYCFGCGVTIDAIQWSIDQLGLSFVDAVKGLVVIR